MIQTDTIVLRVIRMILKREKVLGLRGRYIVVASRILIAKGIVAHHDPTLFELVSNEPTLSSEETYEWVYKNLVFPKRKK